MALLRDNDNWEEGSRIRSLPIGVSSVRCSIVLLAVDLTDAALKQVIAQGKKDLEAWTKMYRDKTIRVTGKVSERIKKPRILISDLKQLKIVEMN